MTDRGKLTRALEALATGGISLLTGKARPPEPQFVCPRGHRHYEGSAFCTVCGAGPVLGEADND